VYPITLTQGLLRLMHFTCLGNATFLVLQKIQQEKSTGHLVAPKWPRTDLMARVDKNVSQKSNPIENQEYIVPSQQFRDSAPSPPQAGINPCREIPCMPRIFETSFGNHRKVVAQWDS